MLRCPARPWAISALLLLAPGCATIRDHKGYLAERGLIGTVAVGVDNRDSVQKTLGDPSFVGQFDASTWYYVSRDTRQFAFRSPKAIRQTVLMVHFDRAGNVAGVERTGLEQIASVRPWGERTPTLGTKHNFFSDLFTNIGTVGSASQTGATADKPR